MQTQEHNQIKKSKIHLLNQFYNISLFHTYKDDHGDQSE